LRALFDRAGLADLTVDTVACLNACAEPTALSFRAVGKWAYLFSNVDPLCDGADVVAFARLYLNSKDGEITDARACGRLRHCLRGRIPAG
jgi:predicted metal-binding protein